jgi:hypothetical protein
MEGFIGVFLFHAPLARIFLRAAVIFSLSFVWRRVAPTLRLPFHQRLRWDLC